MGTTVVIVDDDAAFRRRAREVLAAGGFDVVGEAGGVAGVEGLVASLQPDAVVLDVQLPDGDGFGVAARLHARTWRPEIVLMSARDRREYGRRIEECGALGFLDKLDLTAAALRALLDRTLP